MRYAAAFFVSAQGGPSARKSSRNDKKVFEACALAVLSVGLLLSARFISAGKQGDTQAV